MTSTLQASPPKRTGRQRLAGFVKHAILIAIGLAVILPMLCVLRLSVKTIRDGYQNEIWPQHGLDFGHYAYAWQTIPSLPRNLLNSVFVTLATMVITTLCAVLAAYALVHLRTPGRVLVFGLIVASLFFPVRITGLIGIWEMQRTLDLYNTTAGLILPYVGALPSLA